MNSEANENALLAEELRKLRHEIRWMKRIGIALATLELTDLEGNQAVLGITQNVDFSSGNPQGDSAASLALQHKSGKSLHLTPQ